MSKSPRHSTATFPAFGDPKGSAASSSPATSSPVATATPQLPEFGESVLGIPLRTVCPFSCQTARCYQIWRDDRSSLLPTVGVAQDGSTAVATPVTPTAPQPFPSVPTTNATYDTTTRRTRASVIPNWCRVATSTDLLLVAICILINVPAVAKLLTTTASTTADSLEAGDARPSYALATILSGGPAEASTSSSTGSAAAQTGVRAMLEHLTILLAWFVVTTPTTAVQSLEWIGPALAARLSLWGSGGVLWGATSLGALWTTSVAPYLAAPSIFWSVLILTIVAIRIQIRSHRTCVEELVVVRGLGIQISTRDYRGVVVKSKLLDIGKIRSVFIHEAFFRQQVIFYLGVLMTDESSVTVLLEESLPRLALLRPILCGIRSVLYQESEEGPTLAEAEDPVPAATS